MIQLQNTFNSNTTGYGPPAKRIYVFSCKTKMNSDSVRTPEAILKQIREEFGDFFDPCPYNPKFDPSKDTNGLSIPWKKVTFVNPPYSKVAPWAKKAHLE